MQETKRQIKAMSVPVTGTIREAWRAIKQGGIGVAFLVEPETKRFIRLVTEEDIQNALLSGCGLASPLSSALHLNHEGSCAGMPRAERAARFRQPVRISPLLNKDGQIIDLNVDYPVKIPLTVPSLSEKELLYVMECVLTGWVSSAGRFVTQFEEMFADFCGTRYAIATSNGTTALHLALLALGIGQGDEVIVPTLTFIATANAVTYTGAKPVLVDSDPMTWTIDPNLIEQAITPRTKAIIPVHLYGHPADMDPILQIAKRHGLYLVEDAAEALGARYKGRYVGSIGDVGVFSFYGNKIITTGEGGMVVTDRSDVAQKVRILRDHGMSAKRRYWHPVLGYNYRMTNLQAALGVAQLERVEALLEERRRVLNVYNNELSGVPGVTLPPAAAWADPVCWLYTILIDESRFGISRDSLARALSDKGIETRPMFIPLHMQPIYRGKGGEDYMPIAERLSQHGLSLPSSANLTNLNIKYVAECIIERIRK